MGETLVELKKSEKTAPNQKNFKPHVVENSKRDPRH